MKASIFYILALFRNHLTLTTKLPFLTFFAAKQAAQKNESSQKQSFLIFTFTGSEKSFFLLLLLSLLSIQAERKKGKKERKEEAPRLNLDDNFVEKTLMGGKKNETKIWPAFFKVVLLAQDWSDFLEVLWQWNATKSWASTLSRVR